MFNVFRAVVDRLKGLFAAAACRELEADCLARDAERQPARLPRAGRYESEGLAGPAGLLRHRAESAAAEKPAEGVLPFLAHKQAGESGKPTPAPALLPRRAAAKK